jgi:hypothetical protein
MLTLEIDLERQPTLGPLRTTRGKLSSRACLAAVLDDPEARVFNWDDDLA